MSPPAFRRAVSQGNGWYGFFQDLDATAASIVGLKDAAKRVERPESLGELEISITPIGPVDLDTMKRYEDLGVSRLILLPGRSEEAASRGAPALESALQHVSETSEALKLG